MSRNADVTDYCSVTLETTDRDPTDKTPLEQYRPRGYVAGVNDALRAEHGDDGDPRAVAFDAAVALTASSWGPPFATPHDKATGEWWWEAYGCACHVVERAIVDGVVSE
ncbi:hypothetical protein LPA44_07590 [Halobacterium sp. KA-4]|uniref:hypothetical protein n=1 Tax=Halobacterium sp. KA-4 TaxID=2896367 RepID=UPI001E38797A|nr:hypothetical protein [Halobacterium sp. KA-4]MCD2199758.1 hypothetical protein [Halobacterium sp. KA-4]